MKNIFISETKIIFNVFSVLFTVTALYFVEVQQEDTNKIEVNLYLAIGNQEICVNDELIKKEYAVKREPGGKTVIS